jgi:hypothetical protein
MRRWGKKRKILAVRLRPDKVISERTREHDIMPESFKISNGSILDLQGRDCYEAENYCG